MPPVIVLALALVFGLARLVEAVRDGAVPLTVGLFTGAGFLYLGVRVISWARYW